MAEERSKSVLLRIPYKLWAELNSWAKDDLRSMNGQLEYLLREAVKKRRPRAADADADKNDNP